MEERFDVDGLVTVYRRGDWWHCTYYTPTGRQRRQLKTKNKRQAQRRSREVADLLAKEDWAGIESLDWVPGPQVSTFRDFVFTEYLPKYCDWAESTREKNLFRLNQMCGHLGDMPLRTVTPALIKAYLTQREKEGLSVSTSNRYLATLKTVFKAAVTYGFCHQDPAAQVKMQKEDQKIPEALTEQQVDALIAQCSPRNQAIVALVADTGLRKSELFGLPWGDVDTDGGRLLLGKTKSRKFRVVWLTVRARDILARLRQEQPQAKATDRVFPQTTCSKGLTAAGRRAGIGPVGLHKLRHTFATRLRDRGQPLDRIKELLGHSTMAMTLRYAQARPEQTKSAIDSLNPASPGDGALE